MDSLKRKPFVAKIIPALRMYEKKRNRAAIKLSSLVSILQTNVQFAAHMLPQPEYMRPDF